MERTEVAAFRRISSSMSPVSLTSTLVIPLRMKNLQHFLIEHPEPVAVVKKVKFVEYEQHNTDVLPTPAGLPVVESIGVLPSPPLHMYDPQKYKDLQADKPDTPKEPFPLVVSDTSEYVQEVDEYGSPIYWNTITEEHSIVPVVHITVLNYHQFVAMFLIAIASAAPKSFTMAIIQTIWHPPIQKELGYFIDNACFQWIKDIGQRRMMMIWLFSFKSDLSLKARLVVSRV